MRIHTHSLDAHSREELKAWLFASAVVLVTLVVALVAWAGHRMDLGAGIRTLPVVSAGPVSAVPKAVPAGAPSYDGLPTEALDDPLRNEQAAYTP